MGVLSTAILVIGIVMVRGYFSRALGWLAIAAGVVGAASCGGSGAAIIGNTLS